MANNISSLQLVIDSYNQLCTDESITETIPESIKDEDGSYYPSDLPQVVQDLQDAACCCFITDKGAVNFTMIQAAKNYGISIRKGESDSFGWLSGEIVTPKGPVYFG